MQKHFWSFLLLLVLLTTLIRPPGSWAWRRRGSRRRRSCVPQHCVLDVWRNVGSCSSTCGWGNVLQIRNVRTYQACGGTVCPSPSSPQRRRYANCYNRCCPVNCLWTWSTWGSCSGCGISTQKRTMNIVRNPSCGGTACPGTQSETRSCNTGM